METKNTTTKGIVLRDTWNSRRDCLKSCMDDDCDCKRQRRVDVVSSKYFLHHAIKEEAEYMKQKAEYYAHKADEPKELTKWLARLHMAHIVLRELREEEDKCK